MSQLVYDYAWLCKRMSLGSSDLPYAGEVMQPADNGKCGELVTPRCFSRLNSGWMKNMNRLTRIYGLNRRHCLHELTGSMRPYPGYTYKPGYRLAE